jgi:hypothetical protein
MKNDRFGLLATTTTVGLMFAILIQVAPMLQPLASTTKVASIAISGLSSIGVYRLISSLLYDAFQGSLLLRKLILGKDFLEGTWVGFYKRNGVNRFTIDFFDQESGELTISGKELCDNGKTMAWWETYTTGVDSRTDRLIYSYACDIHEVKGQHLGIGVFKLLRTHKRKPAYAIDGYSADLVDGDKDPNYEHKISCKRIPDNEALERAKKYFL